MSTTNAIGANFAYTEQEQKNIDLCKQYMTIAYDPEKASADAVAHLCTPTATFVGQSTFPKAHTPPEYAAVHREVMDSIHDLKLIQYDWVVAKGNCVVLRYTAAGSHTGVPWHGVAGNGAKATWHAVMMFEVDEKEGKISKMVKEWDKALMWSQLELPVKEYTDVEADLKVTKANIKA